MVTVQCWKCKTEFDIYPSRYALCKYKKFFCTRACKDSTQVKAEGERKETKATCNRRCRDYRYAERRAWIDAIKVKRGCIDCGYRKHQAALHFDHRDPATKEFNKLKVGQRRSTGLS